jgi:hypothetical protein
MQNSYLWAAYSYPKETRIASTHGTFAYYTDTEFVDDPIHICLYFPKAHYDNEKNNQNGWKRQ